MKPPSFDEILAEQMARGDDERLLDDLKEMIVKYDADRPRSLQKVPGPSEAGHPCMRKQAYLISRARSLWDTSAANGLNRFNNPLPSIQGTAMHEWLEKAVAADNDRRRAAGEKLRWLHEQRLVIRPSEYSETETENVFVYDENGKHVDTEQRAKVIREELAGTCDLYDVQTKTVLDWKNPGPTKHKEYTEKGPSEVYRSQAHLYGAGFVRLGLPVETVGIVFIPKGGTMRGIHLWRETFNPELVEEILDRLDDTEERMKLFNVKENPSGFQRIPITPVECNYCPWYSPQPENSFQCSGKAENQ